MAYKLIIGATINIAKLFASIKVTLALDTLSLDFWRAEFCSYNNMETYWNEFSIILGIWALLSYFVFCFLSFFFLFFVFLALSKEVDYSAKANSLPHMSYVSINQSTI